MTTIAAPVPSEEAGSASGQKGLKDNAIGLLSNTVIAIASVAPAYSLAAALGTVVLAVGLQSPVVMLLAFVPMMFVAVGYQQLNKAMPDCGTTFTWATKAFGPKIGWMGGWGIIAADVIVMANLAAIAGSYMFNLFGAYGLAASKWWTMGAGVGWIVVMCLICYIGIEISARIQYGLLAIELIMLVVLSITALGKVYGGSAPHGAIHPAWSWFNPFDVSSFKALTAGMLTAIFIYWGFDTAVSVNEETRDKERAPGVAAVTSTLVLLVTYLLVTVAAQAFAGIGTKGIGLAGNTNDALSVLGSSVFGTNGFGWFLAKLLVVMVLSSAAASTLTTILPTARTTLSMAAYRSIPKKFATIHRRFLTPTWSTVGMGLVSIAFYVLLTSVSTSVLADTIAALGLMIAFYYGMTGFACAWWFRHDLRRGGRELVVKGILPFLGGAILAYFFFRGAHDFWSYTFGKSYWTMPFSPHWKIGGVFLTGVGALVFGGILMFIYRFVNPTFFQGATLNKDTPVLVPDDDSPRVTQVAVPGDS
jgi:amino acid transporter